MKDRVEVSIKLQADNFATISLGVKGRTVHLQITRCSILIVPAFVC